MVENYNLREQSSDWKTSMLVKYVFHTSNYVSSASMHPDWQVSFAIPRSLWGDRLLVPIHILVKQTES